MMKLHPLENYTIKSISYILPNRAILEYVGKLPKDVKASEPPSAGNGRRRPSSSDLGTTWAGKGLLL